MNTDLSAQMAFSYLWFIRHSPDGETVEQHFGDENLLHVDTVKHRGRAQLHFTSDTLAL